MGALRDIAASEEQAVVLSSLARASNPSFSDACVLELSEGTKPPFRVCFPMPDETRFPAGARPVQTAAGAPLDDMRSIVTTFEAGSSHGHLSFAGVVMHFWAESDPTEDDAITARLLVDRALAIVQNERLAQAIARDDNRTAKLAIDLITSRIEGEATGILMARRHVTRAEAAGLLRQASRERQRKLHEIAAGVVSAGDLRSPAESDARGPARPEYLHIEPLNPPTRSGGR